MTDWITGGQVVCLSAVEKLFQQKAACTHFHSDLELRVLRNQTEIQHYQIFVRIMKFWFYCSWARWLQVLNGQSNNKFGTKALVYLPSALPSMPREGSYHPTPKNQGRSGLGPHVTIYKLDLHKNVPREAFFRASPSYDLARQLFI